MSQDQAPVERRKPGRDPMPEAQRARLLCEAAAQVFLRDGYAAARMDDVARGAGMSKRTLYQLYPSKAALFEATIAEAVAPLHLDMELERDPDLRRALNGILLAAAQQLLSPTQSAIFRLVIAEGQRSPELAEAFHRVKLSRGPSALQRRLAAEIAAGRLKLADPEAAAHMLFGMVCGARHMMMMLGVCEAPDAATLSAMAQDAVEVFLAGALRA
ncbi:TetR/AcrR family transcriptional regulator [Falsiroseomonas sp.]|uniref:TetR/AcrR family transcriptional regulator n=1 Tax=Falsiroseomonas sp. TaxID=2870721 RepID=UPI00271FAFC4|nr:TetR/AcrR family transcriptional regulator [Falsiroseomonas sp.]MDO9500144.1 TetR/AcrR family transcriptional regulator [Falsiroseomonas sp.]